MRYKFKGNASDLEVITESSWKALSKTKKASLKDVTIKLSAIELKLMKSISKSVNDKPESIVKDYINYTKSKMIKL